MLKDIYSNPLYLTDVYNLSHQKLKINTDFEVSNITNRNAEMILYGFNEIVTTLLNQRITTKMIEDAERSAHEMGMTFPSAIWYDVVDKLEGRIPLLVEALPDGTYCPKGTPFAQISNTEKGYGELVTWWEGVFLHAHFPSACATRAWRMRQYLDRKNLSPNHFHSFQFRSHDSMENVYWGSTAWSLFLPGTDDFHVKLHAPHLTTNSIPALAHKVVQQYDRELDCYFRAISQASFDKERMVALVIDTYNADRFINDYLGWLLQHAKQCNIIVVFRPDSGDTFGQAKRIYEVAKSLKLLDYCRCIIGEGMTFEKAKKFDRLFQWWKIPLWFCAYGIGGGFHKGITRDTLGFAMKTSYSNGKPRMKFSMDAGKRSLPGRLHLAYNEKKRMVVSDVSEVTEGSLYVPIYWWNRAAENPQVVTQDIYSIKGIIETNENMTQREIIVSDGILKRMQDIKSQYLGNQVVRV